MSAAGVRRAGDLIDRQYTRTLTIADLARCAGMSQGQFCGVDAILSDGVANWFSITEPK